MGAIKVSAAAALLLALAACQTGSSTDGAGAMWPLAADFPANDIVPQIWDTDSPTGWRDIGGGLIGAAPGADAEFWVLNFVRGDEGAAVVVTPDQYDDQGSVAAWRIVTSLHMTPNGAPATPISWESCQVTGADYQTAYARWAPDTTPTDIWFFDLASAAFKPLEPDQVSCLIYDERE